MIVIGIDPGLDGAMALLCTKPAIHIEVSTIPHHLLRISGKPRRRLDMHGTWAAIRALGFSAPDLVVLEDIGGGRPKQSGGVSFGRGAGALEMAIVAAELPLHLVVPTVWKRALKLTSNKDATRLAASRLFPAFAHLWPLIKDDGKAEAALLAWYGATQVVGAS